MAKRIFEDLKNMIDERTREGQALLELIIIAEEHDGQLVALDATARAQRLDGRVEPAPGTIPDWFSSWLIDQADRTKRDIVGELVSITQKALLDLARSRWKLPAPLLPARADTVRKVVRHELRRQAYFSRLVPVIKDARCLPQRGLVERFANAAALAVKAHAAFFLARETPAGVLVWQPTEAYGRALTTAMSELEDLVKEAASYV